MRKVYKLELEVTLEEAEERKAIQAARDHFLARGGARTPVDSKGETWRDIPAEEACSDVVDAIMELIGDNAELEEAGIEVVSLSCVEPKSKDVRPECDENGAEAPEKEELEVGCDNAPGPRRRGNRHVSVPMAERGILLGKGGKPAGRTYSTRRVGGSAPFLLICPRCLHGGFPVD